MNFSPTYELVSKSCPGVTVTLRRMGRKRRAGVELQVAGARAKCREAAQLCARLDGRIQGILDGVDGYRAGLAALPHDAEGRLLGDLPLDLLQLIPPEVWAIVEQKTAAQMQSLAIENAEIDPVFVISAVESFSGIERPFTAAMLCESGPDPLFDEVVAAIHKNAYQTVEETTNLSLPTTSGAQMDGDPKTTTAPGAKSTPNSTSA